MNSWQRTFVTFFAAGVVLSGAGIPLAGQDQPVRAETPALITSCGQSPGPTTIKVVMQKLKLAYDIDPLATPATLRDKAGTPYKSLIIVMGASLKGMGAAGISIEDELKRVSDLIAEARKEGIKIIGAHVEGMKRRAQGATAGDTTDEQSIDAVAPNANILLVYKEGNADGRFTAISRGKKIPLIEFEKMMDLVPTLEKLYGK
jgi:hypothetical protein